MKRFKKVLVPGTFDPVTNGHLNLIQKARDESEEVIVLVLDSLEKNPTFTRLARQSLLTRALSALKFSNVRVEEYDGLLVDAFLEFGAEAIIRGHRNNEELDREKAQAEIQNLVLSGIREKYVYLFAPVAFERISSSMVKGMLHEGVDVSSWVPLVSKRAMEELLLSQCKVSVTGTIASGKTCVARGLCDYFQNALRISAVFVNIDQLVRDLYVEQTEGAQLVREKLASLLGEDVLTADRKAVRKEKVKERLLENPSSDELRKAVHQLTEPHVYRLMRKMLRHHRGLVVFEWALLAEMGLETWSNNNVILVEGSDPSKLAESRGLSSEQLQAIQSKQWSAVEKAAALEASIQRTETGTLMRYTNRFGLLDRDVPGLAGQVLKAIPALERFKKKEVRHVED